MKAAKVIDRRQLADGKRLVHIVCPACDHRHWLPAAETGTCPRTGATFTNRDGAVTTSAKRTPAP